MSRLNPSFPLFERRSNNLTQKCIHAILTIKRAILVVRCLYNLAEEVLKNKVPITTLQLISIFYVARLINENFCLDIFLFVCSSLMLLLKQWAVLEPLQKVWFQNHPMYQSIARKAFSKLNLIQKIATKFTTWSVTSAL